MNDLQKEIYLKRIKANMNVKRVDKEISAMILQVGKLVSAYETSNKLDAKHINKKDELIDSIGDIMIQCTALCEMLGVNIEGVMQKSVAKMRKDYYEKMQPA